MRNSSFFLFVLFSFIFITCGREAAKSIESEKTAPSDQDPSTVQSISVQGVEIPKLREKDKVISHTGFSLLFSNNHKQAVWVAYELTKEETNKIYSRTDRFIPDPKISTGTANNNDYLRSGFDRGHLAPASDMGWSAEAMAESFYYSNISPQAPSFNRGIWKKLEELTRTWAVENEAVCITTGPVLEKNLPSLGANKVSVPRFFYKVILDHKEPEIKAIGFIMPNEGSSLPLQNFAVSIDSVEALTGLDFFHLLPDSLESVVEKKVCIECWSWQTVRTVPASNKEQGGTAVQCKGITKAGERCRNNTRNQHGYCHHHENQRK
jgi:endonuclease G, mitochondrial